MLIEKFRKKENVNENVLQSFTEKVKTLYTVNQFFISVSVLYVDYESFLTKITLGSNY